MLNTNAQALWAEVKGAEEKTKAHLSSNETLIKRYHGPAYMGRTGDDYAGENHAHEYLSVMLPRLVYEHPEFEVETRRKNTVYEAIAASHELVYNQWARDVGLGDLLESLVVDMMFGYGVALVSIGEGPTITSEAVRRRYANSDYGEPFEGFEDNDQTADARVWRVFGDPQMAETDPRWDAKVQWPAVSRVPPRFFFIDPGAKDRDNARFMGHRWIADLDDLIARAEANPDDWDVEAVKGLSTTSDVRELGYDTRQYMPSRNLVVGRDVWIPEVFQKDHGPDEGFSGSTYTLGLHSSTTNKPALIRPPRPYYGPKSGPYQIFGAYKIPNQTLPMSPLVAVEGQITELDRQMLAISRENEAYKRQVVAPKNVADTIKSTPHDHVVGIPDELTRESVHEIVMGGTSRELIEYASILQERVDTTLGAFDAQSGNVTGKGTATENVIADRSSSARVSWLERAVQRDTGALMAKVGHFFYYEDRIIAPMGIADPDAPPGTELLFTGGDHDPESGFTFEDLEISVSARSMRRQDDPEFRQAANELHARYLEALPAIQASPDPVFWAWHFNHLGESLGIPDAGAMAARLAEMAMAMMGQGQGPQSQPAQPQRMQSQTPRMPDGGSSSPAGSGGMAGAPRNMNGSPMGMPASQGTGREQERVRSL